LSYLHSALLSAVLVLGFPFARSFLLYMCHKNQKNIVVLIDC
jgi:hypothetical protein